MHNVEKKLSELGLVLPAPSGAIATYVPYVMTENMIIISGQLPMQEGEMVYKGKVGADVSLAQGQDAARLCGLNILVQLKAALLGDWARVVKCARIGGFVNCVDTFTDQPQVINGASDLMVAVFGEEVGRHARAAVGVNSLPRGAAVEVEAMFIIRE
jgi:enamine deaminase RidA (YjgF/YER057c/UK114 family)